MKYVDFKSFYSLTYINLHNIQLIHSGENVSPAVFHECSEV